ncbi:hypothetical protein [Brevundimonas sp. DS20]|uniref:hypothetical protein n=1 Tax=Brevundimonas sp. DS20 TaxID=1532555 RepID=UPI000B296E75|nr:hypothetical protein [Brevundimonas sp. DS20]
MTPDALRKGLRAGGWMAAVGAALVLTAVLLNGLGFRWDPLNLEQRRRVRAEARASEAAASAKAEGEARRHEQAGTVEQLRRLEHFKQQEIEAGRATAAAVSEAKRADDANTVLESRRADRLRAHDRELCRLAPDLAGCARASDPARDGEPPLRPGDPAGGADPG